jgi:hypothetical protein
LAWMSRGVSVLANIACLFRLPSPVSWGISQHNVRKRTTAVGSFIRERGTRLSSDASREDHGVHVHRYANPPTTMSYCCIQLTVGAPVQFGCSEIKPYVCPSSNQVSRSGSQLDAWRRIWAASPSAGRQPGRSCLFGGVLFVERRQKCQSFSGPALRT